MKSEEPLTHQKINLVFPVIVLSCAFIVSFLKFDFMFWYPSLLMHELGHAAASWFSGFAALPLPFGFTFWQTKRSAFTIIGLAVLIALFFFSSKKNGYRGAMALAVLLWVVQFYGTVILSAQKAEVFKIIGGCAGEIVLSTFIIVTYFFPLPQRFRWDFWKYLFFIWASVVFVRSARFWESVAANPALMPYGSLLGDEGDIERLIESGMSAVEIINFFRALSQRSLVLIASAYLVAVFVSQRKKKFLRQF